MRRADELKTWRTRGARGRSASGIIFLAGLIAIGTVICTGISCSKSHQPVTIAPPEMPSGPGSPTDSLELAQNWDLWRAAGRSNYDFYYRRWCFCVMADVLVSIRVRENLGQSIEVVENPHSHDWQQEELQRYLSVTIDSLFSVVEEAVRIDSHELRVAYNPQSGYPEFVSIDYNEQMVDEEITFQARLED